MKRRRGREAGFLLIEAAGPPSPLKIIKTELADRIEVETTADNSAAAKVFSANELNARIEAMAEIVASGQALFEDGPAVGEDVRHRCSGCGKPTPAGEKTLRRQPSKVPGWVVQTLAGEYNPVIWCPECVAMPGFGCVEEEEPDETPVPLTLRGRTE